MTTIAPASICVCASTDDLPSTRFIWWANTATHGTSSAAPSIVRTRPVRMRFRLSA